MDTLEIICITDENYAMPTGITLLSLKENKNEGTKVNVHILCNNVGIQRKRQFLEMCSEDFAIELIDVAHINLPGNIELLTEHVSISALYKFYIPSLFPQLDRALYLDGDLIIRTDISQIYNEDISGKYAAVVKDMAPMVLYNPPINAKLKVKHSAYFNSGVMLLNLQKMREDGIEDKLIDYRIHGINFFMDQDTFNVVLEEQVVYLPVWDNYLVTLDEKFSAHELSEYYKDIFPSIVKERWEKARILHMASKLKPWKYQLPIATDIFMEYYRRSPYQSEKIVFVESDSIKEENSLSKRMKDEVIKEPNLLEILSYIFSSEQGCSGGKTRDKKITISLTTFPARIKTLDRVILTLLKQTMKPDRIVLWLAEEDFPHKEAELPWTLLALRRHGLEIHWCDNLYPHKKYYYSMLKYPDDIVITVDDDVAYSKYLVEVLYGSYLKHPHAISALRTHLMKFDSNGELLPYSQWYYQCLNYVDVPLRSLFATGVGGILYPPNLLNEEWKNKEKIKETSLYADDIWLKTMQVMNNIPVVLASRYQRLVFVGNTQDNSLFTQNVHSHKNDDVLKKLFFIYNEWNGVTDTLIDRIKEDIKTPGKLIKPEKNTIPKKNLKNEIKKYIPMPINSFMREMGILKREHKEIRFILCRNHEKSYNDAMSILQQLERMNELLLAQQQQIKELNERLNEKV